MKVEKTPDRRQFFKSCTRSVCLGILTLGGGTLVLRRNNEGNPHHSCINRGICRGCREFNACRLPQALSAKRYQDRHATSMKTAQMRPNDVSGQE